jgi:hypothetical protein
METHMAQTPRRPSPHLSADLKGRLMSTSEGRQRFPDLLQSTFGDKAVIGFERYGRVLGAVVPMEAIRLLAGFDDSVDDATRDRITKTAKALIREVPAEAEMCGIADFDFEDEMIDVDRVKEDRKVQAKKRRPNARQS